MAVFLVLQQSTVGKGEIAALNGVRGLAIIAVLLVHSYQGVTRLFPPHAASFLERFLEAGTFGVDLFFVLSGFLITSILLKKRSQPGYFRNFYARRFLRLFPLYYGFLLLVAFAIPLVQRLTHSSMLHYTGSWWWYLLYLSNWKAENGAQDPFLGHFWSLAVEEQFYLIWPAVVLFLSRRQLAIACLGIIVGATALRGYLMAHGVDWLPIYRLTVTRFDVLAFGALIALAVQSSVWRPRVLRWSLSAGIAGTMLFVVLAIYAGTTSWEAKPIQLWSPVFAGLAFAALVAYASTDPQGLLTWRWLTWAGLYSYAAYVLHVVFFIYGSNLQVWLYRHLPSMSLRLAAGVAVSLLEWTLVFAAAALSRKYFEGPFLDYKKHFENRPRTSATVSVPADLVDTTPVPR